MSEEPVKYQIVAKFANWHSPTASIEYHGLSPQTRGNQSFLVGKELLRRAESNDVETSPPKGPKGGEESYIIADFDGPEDCTFSLTWRLESHAAPAQMLIVGEFLCHLARLAWSQTMVRKEPTPIITPSGMPLKFNRG